MVRSIGLVPLDDCRGLGGLSLTLCLRSSSSVSEEGKRLYEATDGILESAMGKT